MMRSVQDAAQQWMADLCMIQVEKPSVIILQDSLPITEGNLHAVVIWHAFGMLMLTSLSGLWTLSTCSPNFSQPWQMHQQTKCTATGFVVAPLSSRRILTNAHAVANEVAIKVRKHGSAQRYTARVLAVGHEVSGSRCHNGSSSERQSERDCKSSAALHVAWSSFGCGAAAGNSSSAVKSLKILKERL
jgi:hypothetical protein